MERDTSRNNVVESLRQIKIEHAFEIESRLKQLGLLSHLENIGILPVPKDPNPYNYKNELEKYNSWWDGHPEKEGKYVCDSDLRLEVLKCLYIGAILGHRFPSLVFHQDEAR
jgi:hypothetical protein